MIELPEAPHAQEVDSLIQLLKTSKKGLNEKDVKLRQAKFGLNEIPDPGGRPLWKIILKQFTNLMVYILLIAALISYFTGHYIDTYVILVIILINALIGFIQEYKAEGAVAALKNLLVPKCKVIRDGKLQTIHSKNLVPGDLISIEEGDNVPADARIIYEKNARTIESSLTGESAPVNKDTAPLNKEVPLGDKVNMVWKSTFLASGSVEAIVTGTGMNTKIGEIAKSLKNIEPKKTNFQLKTDKLAKQMAFIAIGSAVLLFLVSYFFQEAEISEILLISIAALVSTIPEGLPAVLSIVLAIGSYRMSKSNAIIREISATESLGSVSTIVTDKTGTLTQNTMTIKTVWIPGGETVKVEGEGWESSGDLVGDKSDVEALNLFLEISAHCHQTAIKKKKKGQYQVTGDPTEAAFLVLANKAGKSKELEILQNNAFDSDLKYRSTLVKKEGKPIRFYIGAPEAILDLSTMSRQKEGDSIKMSKKERDLIHKKISVWSKESYRVLALAQSENASEKTKDDKVQFIGLAGMIDPPRPGVLEAVQSCQRAGIRVIMATGDHAETALAISKKVGIVKEGRDLVYTDAELSKMNEKNFDKAVQNADVFSRLTPLMKLKIAKSLQKNGDLIAMTGDGVNDAPALKQANIGISMGIMGTDVAKDASVMVLADDNFTTIVKAIEQGRIVFNNARRTSFFLVTTNFAEILTLISAVSLGLAMPLTATQILWINLITDGFCDKALATEKGIGDELDYPPIDPSEKILNKTVLPFLAINIFIMVGLSITAFLWYMPQGIEKARTMVFITMAFSQLFNALNMRSLNRSTIKLGVFGNKWLNYALLISLAIQMIIIEVPFLSNLFSFKQVSLIELLIWAGLTSFVFWFTEIFKYFKFHHSKK
jgi:P-type Ca2+ transporter type 2C